MRLKEMSIEIIRKCPNNCVHCSSCSSINQEETIPFETFCRVIDDGAKLGLKTVCFSGGEPFLHPDLYKMVDYSFKSGIDVYIYTSGIVVHDNTACSIPFELIHSIKNKVKKLIFNVEASTEETYDKIMGTQGYFQFLLESIQEATNIGIVCETHFVPMKFNILEIESTIELCNRLGILKISFLRLVLHGCAEKNKDKILLSSKETKQLKKKLYDIFTLNNSIGIRIGTPLAGEECKHNCEAATGKLNIKYDGRVYPCEVFKNKKVPLIDDIEADSIYEKSLVDIYHNSLYLNLIREYIKKFSSQINDENCIGQHYINSVEEDYQ